MILAQQPDEAMSSHTSPSAIKSEFDSRPPSPSNLSVQSHSPISKQPSPDGNSAQGKDADQPTCSNCKTQTTPLWRRSEDGILCNACALYQKMKGCPRPVSLKTDTIKHRNRSKGTKKEKLPGPQNGPPISAAKDGVPPAAAFKAKPKNSARSSSTARKSQPGGADMDDRDSSFDESPEEHHPGERSMSKRRKRDSLDPDSEMSPPPPIAPPYSESMYPPHAMLGEQALRHYAAQFNARSSSADTRAGHHYPPLRFGLQGRSPSQPAVPYTSAAGFRPQYAPYDALSNLRRDQERSSSPYSIRAEDQQSQHQPNWTEAMKQPVRSAVTTNGSTSHSISLPPIRSLTDEIDSEARGRARGRMALPPFYPGASGLQSSEGAPRNASQVSSRASTVTGVPFSRGLPSDVGPHDHGFPQSDSRRPQDALSDSSSGSNSAGSPPSTFQSPAIAPTMAGGPAPAFGGLPDAALGPNNHPASFGASSSERRGRSTTRKLENDIGNRIEALRMADPRSRSSSPRPSNWPQSSSQLNSGEQSDASQSHWQSSRSRTSSPHPGQSPSGGDADEMNKLRMRVNELELINSLLVSRLTELEATKRPAAAEQQSQRGSSVHRSYSGNISSLAPPREDHQGELRAAEMEQA